MVVAFEIKWEDICGLNYHNPLCIDGRVVLEAAKLTKRQFLTVSLPAPVASHTNYQTRLKPLEPLESLFCADERSTEVLPEACVNSRASVSTAHQACCLEDICLLARHVPSFGSQTYTAEQSQLTGTPHPASPRPMGT